MIRRIKSAHSRRPLTSIPSAKSNLFQDAYVSPLMSPQILRIHRSHPIVIEKLYRKKCEDLRITVIPEQLTRFIEKIQQQLSTNTLNLSELSLTPNCIPLIMQLVKNIPFVNLQLNPVADGVMHIQLTMISLTLCNCAIGPKGFAYIFHKLASNQTLYHLNIGNPFQNERNRLGLAVQDLADALSTNVVLAVLDISGCGINDLDILNKAFARNQTLLHVNLADNDLRQPLTVCKTLEILNLRNNPFGQNILLISEQIKPQSRYISYLRELNLTNCKINLIQLHILLENLEKSQNLQTLVLDENMLIGENNLCISSYLAYNNWLLNLSMKKCSLSTQFIMQLASGLSKNTKLRSIDLSKNAIDLAAANALAEGLSTNTTLRGIKMKRCGLNDEGSLELFKVFMKSNICELDFSHNLLGDQTALYAIQMIKRNPELLHFGFEKNINSYETQKQMMRLLGENAQQQRKLVMPTLIGTVERMSNYKTENEKIAKKKEEFLSKRQLAEQELKETQKQYSEGILQVQNRTQNTEARFYTVKEELLRIQKEVIEIDKAQNNCLNNLDDQAFAIQEQIKAETSKIATLQKNISQDQGKSRSLQSYYKQNLETLKIQEDGMSIKYKKAQQELTSFQNQLEIQKKQISKKSK